MRALLSTLAPRLRAYSHVLRSRARSKDRVPPQPHACHLVLTWRCNLRCRACDAWQRPKGRELEAEQWIRILSQLSSLDIVKIIGGEPLVREDLGVLLDGIRRENDPFIVQVVTNGVLTDETIRLAERYGWPGLHLRLSLNGAGDGHDRARGVPGTFERVMETMRGLAKVRRRVPFHLAVNYTLTDDSLDDLPLVRRLCRDLGVDVVPGLAVKPFLRHSDLENADVGKIGVSRDGPILASLNRRENGVRSGFNLIEQVLIRLVNRTVFRKHITGGDALRFPCRELRNLAYFLPGGELVTCGLKHEPAGDLAVYPFAHVWEGAEAERLRAEVDRCTGCLQGAVEILSRLYCG